MGRPWSPAHYVPTPEEIRAACDEIQARWTAAERERREHGCDDREAMTVPVVTAREWPRPDEREP
jgi:hypothetical protein